MYIMFLKPNLLPDISQDDIAIDLYERLVSHYSARLRYHVQSFLRLLQRYKVNADIIHACRQFQAGEMPALEIVERANTVAADTTFLALVRALNNGDATTRMLNELHCIRRPQLACDAICKAARDVDGFQKIMVRLLSGYSPRKPAPCLPTLNHSSMSQLGKVKWVHAEIRMVTYLLNDDNFYRAFPYLGLSKKTCLLCGHIINHMGRFNTRANHGKIYSQWTVPSVLKLDDTSFETWSSSVERIRDILRIEAARHDIPRLQEVKESTIRTPLAPRVNKPSIFTSYVNDPLFQEREAIWFSSFNNAKVSQYVSSITYQRLLTIDTELTHVGAKKISRTIWARFEVGPRSQGRKCGWRTSTPLARSDLSV
jgi:hypothetical protein